MRTLSSLLCQPAPNTAETTQLGAMRTQACIPQFLHTNETSENLSNALHALFIHCLQLSARPLATRGLRSLTSGAGPRLPDQIAERSPAPTSGGSDNRPTCVPHRFRSSADYPHFAIFTGAPAPGRRGRASSGRRSFLRAHQPASSREGISAHVTRARAYGTAAGVWQRRGRREFANTNCNQDSWGRGGERSREAHALRTLREEKGEEERGRFP